MREERNKEFDSNLEKIMEASKVGDRKEVTRVERKEERRKPGTKRHGDATSLSGDAPTFHGVFMCGYRLEIVVLVRKFFFFFFFAILVCFCLVV